MTCLLSAIPSIERGSKRLVNLVVWGIWLVVASNTHSWWPWPVFLTLFWGIGLVMNAWDVYFRKPKTEAELQREVRRLQGDD